MADLRADTERFTFEVEGLDDDLRVVRFQGSEAVSQLFRFDLTVATESADLEFGDVVNKAALLTIDGDSPRHIKGIVSRMEVSGQSGRFTLYDLTLVPPVWRLKLRLFCNAFCFSEENPESGSAKGKQSGQLLKDIVSDILSSPLGGVPTDAFHFDLAKDRIRNYCVQYRESDWDFASRLLEEEGIFYYFEHTEDLCKLMIADHPSAHADIAGDPKLPYVPASGLKTTEEHVTRFTYSEEVRPGTVSLADYNFIKPGLDLTEYAFADDFGDLEVYDYPGGYLDKDAGKQLAAVRLAALNAMRRVGSGESDSPRLVPGFQFELSGHPREALNVKYTLTEVYHTGEQPQVLEERAGGGGQVYRNRFECIPAGTDYRPPRVTPKPIVEGVQTAIVVGPKGEVIPNQGEEIYTDEFGRVKVHFHWDRSSVTAAQNPNSCWIRVSQAWAGESWGAIHIPRIGQEVIVDFEEGDPDRPIITGRVYNGTHRPPYKLPDHKTQSGIKSNTSPGGRGSNELRFEDKAGSEEVFLHAQKDLNETVKNNHSTSVGATQTLSVKGDQKITVEKERWDEVKGYHNFHVTGNQEITVDGDGGAGFAAVGPYTVSSSKKVEVVVDNTSITEDDSNITLDATTKVTLHVGGSTIEVTGDGVSVKASKITLAGTQEVKLQVGNSSITLDAKGVTTSGPKISTTAVGMHEISGALIKIN